jgi:glycopeptide antibiotics resistance protein
LHRLAGLRLGGAAAAVVVVFFVVWAIGVANLTLFVAPGNGPRNLVPFRTIGEYLLDHNLADGLRLRNLGGNLIMLLPLGMVLAAITRWRVARVATVLIAASAGIELWQLLVATGRSADVDDVTLNVAGGIAGWLVGLGLLHVAEIVVPSVLAGPDAAIADERAGSRASAESLPRP